ncbi:MAG: CotH kinase family protein [Clostridia bacterium]|nr:CotH kinase family protein [Clostridia bacterium]
MKKSVLIRILALVLSLIFVCQIFASCANANGNENGNDETSNESAITSLLGELIEQGATCKIVYKNGENGHIEGETEQNVKKGEFSSEVKAVADDGYLFVGWSDGKMLNPRKDLAQDSDIEVTPVFKKLGTDFEITYRLIRNGEVVDEVTKKEKVGRKIVYIAVEADFAYQLRWSDGQSVLTRSDGALYDGQVMVGEYIPKFMGAPAICINTEDGLGIESRTEYKSCTVSVYNAEEDQCFKNLGARIRGRGNSSWDAYPKKGFKLKFDEKVSMLGSSNKDKDWVFISNHGDKSFVRNMIGYEMSERMSGLEFTMKHEYIDVYLNGSYYGFFMMCDSVEAGNGRVDIDKSYNSDPAQMGYMIEIGETDPGELGVDYFRAARDNNFAYCVKLPDTDDPEYDPNVHLVYIENYIDQCLAALSEENWTKICELIDIDSFIDYYIIQEMFMNKDAFWRSIMFYKKPGGKLYAGPIWDLDQGAGNIADMIGKNQYETTPDADINYEYSQYKKAAGSLWVAGINTWYRRLLRNSEFKAMLRSRLIEFEPILNEVLELASTDRSDKDSYYAIYGDAMNRNFERWDIMGQKIWPNTPAINEIMTVKGQIDYMREWLLKRYDVICDHYGIAK